MNRNRVGRPVLIAALAAAAGWLMRRLRRIGFADMELLLARQGEACVPITRSPRRAKA